MIEADRPLAGPAAASVGGLVLFVVALLAYSPSNPYFSASVPVADQALLFVFVGPGLGPIVGGLGALAYLRPRYRVGLGTAIVPLAVLGAFEGGAGGLLIGPAAGVAGGLLCIAFESKSDAASAADEAGALGSMRRYYGAVPVAFAVAGILLAVAAPAFASIGCPASIPCSPGESCPAISTACGGPPVWVVLLACAVLTAPLAFRLRAELGTLPLPT